MALGLSGIAGLTLALDARGGTVQITVGPLTILSSKASGTVSGLPPGTAVTIDGSPYTADGAGNVTLALTALDGDSALTLQFTDAGGVPRSASATLVDSVTGNTLTPAEIADPIPNVSRSVDLAVEVSDGTTSSTTTTTSSTTTGGGGGGGSGGGGTTTNGTTTTTTTTTTPGGSLPPGAVKVAGGLVSIPVSSVQTPQRLVVRRVVFTPTAMRSPTRAVLARVEVRDSRGYVVRGAVVTVRNRVAAHLRPVAARSTSLRGIATIRLFGRPAAWTRPGTRLVLTVRATRKGRPTIAARPRVVQLRVVRAR